MHKHAFLSTKMSVFLLVLPVQAFLYLQRERVCRFDVSKNQARRRKYHRLAWFLHLKGRIGWRVGVIVALNKWIRKKITFHFSLWAIESAHILKL